MPQTDYTDFVSGRKLILDIAAGGVSLPVVDSTSIIKGSSDETKQIRFEVDGLTTTTTRVLTPQDKDYILADKADLDSHGEGHITILPMSYDSIGQGNWILGIHTAYYTNGRFYNLGGNDADNISYKVCLSVGTYTLVFMNLNGSDACITDIDIDGEEVASFDCYATSGVNVFPKQTGIVVTTAGIKTLKVRVDGKNPSSSNYYCRILYLALWRTA